MKRHFILLVFSFFNLIAVEICAQEVPVSYRNEASVLVGNNIERITKEFELQKKRTPYKPEVWDGYAAERCLKELVGFRIRER